MLRKQPSAFLLAVQLLVVMLLPLSEGSPGGRAVITLLSLSAVVAAVFTVRSTPALTWLSITLALPAAVFEIWMLVHERPTFGAIAHAALALFYFYTSYALVSYVFEDFWVTKDEFFAVAACFTVLVFAFAYLYLAVQKSGRPPSTPSKARGSATYWSCSTSRQPTSRPWAFPTSDRSGPKRARR